MKLFDLDSPLMQGLSKMADMMILNLLTLLCCLPIITVGPAFTALNYMSLKLVRNEECYIVKGYFKSFKENFRQSVVIWMLLLIVAILLVIDFYIMISAESETGGIMLILIFVAAIFWLCTALYVFPVLARFHNTIKATVKNAFLMSIMQFPKTVVMAVAYLIPLVLFIYFLQLTPIVLFFGFSAPAWVSAKLNDKLFKKLENKYLEEQGPIDSDIEEDEHIFHDELDETLQDKPMN